MRAADVRPFVPVEAEPAEILEDRRLRLAGRPLDVGVLNPQNERAAGMAGSTATRRPGNSLPGAAT